MHEVSSFPRSAKNFHYEWMLDIVKCVLGIWEICSCSFYSLLYFHGWQYLFPNAKRTLHSNDIFPCDHDVTFYILLCWVNLQIFVQEVCVCNSWEILVCSFLIMFLDLVIRVMRIPECAGKYRKRLWRIGIISVLYVW